MISGIPGDYSFILASGSPRREMLLKETGLPFRIVTKDYKEEYSENMSGKEVAENLAMAKASYFSKNLLGEKEILITADTVVWFNNMILAKPADYNEAFRILCMISGNTHEVITGISLVSRKHMHTFSECTHVTFNVLTDKDIDYYINAYKPYDKAGAYGIQEWIGLIGISRIEGSYFNVMGLPVHRLIEELREFIKKIQKKK